MLLKLSIYFKLYAQSVMTFLFIYSRKKHSYLNQRKKCLWFPTSEKGRFMPWLSVTFHNSCYDNMLSGFERLIATQYRMKGREKWYYVTFKGCITLLSLRLLGFRTAHFFFIWNKSVLKQKYFLIELKNCSEGSKTTYSWNKIACFFWDTFIHVMHNSNNSKEKEHIFFLCGLIVTLLTHILENKFSFLLFQLRRDLNRYLFIPGEYSDSRVCWCQLLLTFTCYFCSFC